MTQIVVVGAGIGGLTTAALLARAGLDVTVLEAHVYPGGCAGTFYHQGYRFDAGATLAAGFEPGGVMTRMGELLGIDWPIEPAREAMVVHLPDGSRVTRWQDPAAWQAERLAAFGPGAEPFWRWQETAGSILWEAAARGTPWPPASAAELAALVRTGLHTARQHAGSLPGLLADALRPAASHLPAAGARLADFVDAQLLISAQTTADRANALYAAAALDLARHGVAHLHGGLGALGVLLTTAIREMGGRVLFHQGVTRVLRSTGGSDSAEGAGSGRSGHDRFVVETNKGAAFPADRVIFNLAPWDARALLAAETPDDMPSAAAAPSGVPADGWGAFVIYAGVEADALPADLPLHHQVVARRPLGEGNSIFLTLSLPGDEKRAPAGKRAVTISSHTALRPWWDLYHADREAYEARKQALVERVWQTAEIAIPGLSRAASLVMPGTPITFQRFTHRSLGWVGGFPQTSLTRFHSPRLGPGLWLVGDSVFPGQSTLAVTLGGLRVAQAVLAGIPAQAAHPGIELPGPTATGGGRYA